MSGGFRKIARRGSANQFRVLGGELMTRRADVPAQRPRDDTPESHLLGVSDLRFA